MTILYAAIARDTDGLMVAESQSQAASGAYNDSDTNDNPFLLEGGNFSDVASQLFRRLAEAGDAALLVGNRRTFVQRADVEEAKTAATMDGSVGGGGAGAGSGEGGGCGGCGDGYDDYYGILGWFGCTADGSGGMMGTEGFPYWSMGGAGNGDTKTASASSSHVQFDHYFHVLRGEGAFYAALSDDVPGKNFVVNFDFLDEVQREFSRICPPHKLKRQNNKDGAYTKAFAKTFRTVMHRYNTSELRSATAIMNDEKVRSLNADVDQLKSVMGNNIRLALKRSDRLDKMLHRTFDLEAEATVFKKRSKVLKKQEVKSTWKLNACIGMTIVAVLVLLSMVVCGPTYGRCRSKELDSEYDAADGGDAEGEGQAKEGEANEGGGGGGR